MPADPPTPHPTAPPPAETVPARADRRVTRKLQGDMQPKMAPKSLSRPAGATDRPARSGSRRRPAGASVGRARVALPAQVPVPEEATAEQLEQCRLTPELSRLA